MTRKAYDHLTAYLIENQDKFYRLAYSYVRNQEDALDIVQNAVCKALEKRETLRNKTALRTWFYKILVNESLIVLNDKKRLTLSESGELPESVSEEADFSRYDDLYDQISLLDPDTQSIIRLKYFEELSLEEISVILGKNISTVKSKLYRGLTKLKAAAAKGDYL